MPPFCAFSSTLAGKAVIFRTCISFKIVFISEATKFIFPSLGARFWSKSTATIFKSLVEIFKISLQFDWLELKTTSKNLSSWGAKI